MKRPLTSACLVYLGTLALSVLLPSAYTTAAAVVLTAVAVLLFIISCFKKPIVKIAALFLISALTVTSFIIYHKVTVEPSQRLAGKECNITGTVLESDLSSSGNRFYVVKLRTVDENAAPRDTRIRLYCQNYDNLHDYDDISANVKFFSNDAVSSYERYYLSNSIYGSATTLGDISITNADEFSLLREICQIRDKIVFNIRSNIPDERGDIISGILFGKRDYISDETTDLFATSGISHLLAVSGLHLTIIIFLLDLLLVALGTRKNIRTIISLLLTLIMMIMTGFTPSIVRAAVMTSLSLIGATLRRDYDSPTAMCLSAVILCFANPYAITNIGFLLSFSATTGLIVSQNIISTERQKFSMKTVKIPRLVSFEIMKLILPCFFAFMFTIPVSACVFGYTATYSPIVNFIISPIIPILLAFALLASILSLTPFSFLYQPLFYVSKILISCIIWIAENISSLPFAKIYLPSDFAFLIIIFAILAFAIAMLSKKPYKNSLVAALLCIPVVCTAVMSQAFLDKDTVKISVIDSSTSSVVIEYRDKYFISGFSDDGAYNLSSALSDESNSVVMISAPSLKSSDVAAFTHFINNNDISHIAVPKEHSAAIASLGKDYSKRTYISENFSLEFEDISITTQIYGKNTLVLYDIDGFKMA